MSSLHTALDAFIAPIHLLTTAEPAPAKAGGQALGATLRAACAVQIGYPADLSRLSFCAIFTSPGEKSGLGNRYAR